MPNSLRSLILEDSATDAELLVYELEKAGFNLTWRSVGNEEEFRDALQLTWDIVLADYHLPQFDAIAAIRLLHDLQVDVPVIVLTGFVGDEAAAECIKEGATDYLLKDRLARVGSAVRGALVRHRLEAQRRKAENLLRESEERFRTLANAMPQIVWTARPDGTYDYFNDRWYEYSGLARDTSPHSAWDTVIEPEDLLQVRLAWADQVASGEPFEAEFRLRCAHDGEYRWHLTRAVAVSDGSGKLSKWYGTTTDIHDQKLSEQALERSNHMLRQFAYAAAHDLQEPLRNVATAGELLHRRYSGQFDGDADGLLHECVDSTQRMHQMVKDLLAYMKVIDRKSEPAPLVDASHALSAALAKLQGPLQESGAVVVTGALPVLRVHETHMIQLFLNLIGNSVKFRRAAEPPRIQISSEVRNREQIFRVQDNGIGFDTQYADLIFGVFKRLHLRHEYPGTGMGLAICSRIVEYYNGRIWAESSPGAGAVFYFALPLSGAPA